MTTKVVNKPIYQGEGKWWPFSVVNQDGDAVDLSSASLVFQVRDSIGGTLVFAADKFDITEAASGIIKVNMPASQTLTMDPGTYYGQLLVVVQTDTDVEMSDYLKFTIKLASVANRTDTSISPSASPSKSSSSSPSASPSASPST